jgi:zinc/manganese transport system permease protein
MWDTLILMKWPLAACLVLPWLLVYLGLHIVQRGIIFVDLALAQVAALGGCVSLLLGYDVHQWQSLALSLGFTLLGAVLLTSTRAQARHAVQEALIGIIYVVAAAASILVLSRSAKGKEELEHLLVGDLLPVDGKEVLETLAVFLFVGVAHYLFRRQFMALSFGGPSANRINPHWWDFIFYCLFGLVVMAFVHIAGVLLVFTYLIVPAVCAGFLAKSLPARFLAGWGIATAASLASLLVTAKADLPIGATIVCGMGVFLALTLLGKLIVTRVRKRPA